MTLPTIGFLLVLAVAVVWFGQRSLMYFPDSQVPSPVAAGLPAAETVHFQTDDELDLWGWFVPPRGTPTGYTVVVFNGNAGNRGDRAPLAERLSRQGLAVFLFDYRGYGGNPGLPHEAGLTRDARGALRYLRARSDVDPTRIVFFGESLGTAVAIRLATVFEPAALILRSPFTSFVALGERHYPFLAPRFLLRDRHDAARHIGRLRSPVLMIAGEDDTIVPLDESRALFELAQEPKRLIVIPGADHNDAALAHGPEVLAATRVWLGLDAPEASPRAPLPGGSPGGRLLP